MSIKRFSTKKASVPVTVLVIGIFALCTFALITFFVSQLKFNNSFSVVDDLRISNVYVDQWKYYENLNLSNEQILSKMNFSTFEEKGYTFEFSFEDDFINPSLDKIKIYGFISSGYFIDIGVPGDYQKAQIELKKYWNK